MRRLLIFTALMFISSFVVLAYPSAIKDGKTTSSSKIKAEQLQKISEQLPPNFFKDFTLEAQKERLAHNGILVSHSFESTTLKSEQLSPAKIAVNNDAQSYTLIVNLKYEKENIERVYSGTAFSNYSDNLRFSSIQIQDPTPDKIEYCLPQGSYDIEVRLSTINMDVVILTATDVNVNEDMEIVLDVNDATVEINWNALMPDGNIPYGDTPIYDPETFELVDFVEGNLLLQLNDLIIYNKKHDFDDLMSFNPERLFIGDTELEIGQGNIQIMPNDNYMFYLEKKVIAADGGYIIPLMTSATQSVTVTNDINNYITLKPEFVETPYQAEPIIVGEGDHQMTIEFNKDNAFFLNYASIINSKMTGTFATAIVGGDKKIQKNIYVCQDSKLKDTYNIMPIPSLLEDWQFNPSTALPIDLTHPEIIASAINNTSEFNGYLHLPDDKNIYVSTVINPWLSFDINKSHIWNYGCPALVFSTIKMESDSFFNFTYIGRLGENRRIDLLSTELRVAVNNMSPSDEILQNLQWGRLPETGRIDFLFTDTNVAIDEFSGKNITRVGFDMSRSDWEPPTLQIVRFVDKDNNFTDRYNIPDDGVIEFYGGDFTYNYNSEINVSWYSEEPAAEVKVEYAPYGTDSFLPLEVENIPEQDFMPGFGTYYRGSLAGVNRKSENGWFDVRITLTDAAGNFQEQTLSPAFKIEDSVGVESVASPEVAVSVANRQITVCGCENPIVEVYSTDGILLRRVASSNVNASNLTHGIYLINISDGNKQVVRKVRI